MAKKSPTPEPQPANEPSTAKKKRPRSLLDPKTGRVKPGALKGTRKRADDLPPLPPKKSGPKPKPIKFTRKTKEERDAEKKAAADAQDLRIHELRMRILDLRRYASIRQISQHLKDEGFSEGVSVGAVHGHLCAALDEMRNELTLNAERYVAFELEKLEHKENSVAPNLIRMAEKDRQLLRDGGEVKYADGIEKYDRVLDRLAKRRDALLGVLKPQKVEHSGVDGGPIETSVVTRVILPKVAESEELGDE